MRGSNEFPPRQFMGKAGWGVSVRGRGGLDDALEDRVGGDLFGFGLVGESDAVAHRVGKHFLHQRRGGEVLPALGPIREVPSTTPACPGYRPRGLDQR